MIQYMSILKGSQSNNDCQFNAVSVNTLCAQRFRPYLFSFWTL